jgi:hypothetical protein
MASAGHTFAAEFKDVTAQTKRVMAYVVLHTSAGY